jgi:type I restriction enzyme S subunit
MSGLPRGWVEDEASTICELVQSGGTPKEGFIDKPGVPFLKVYNIVDQKIDFDYRPQFIDVEIHRSSMAKSQAFPGDVLMNIVGPPLGKVAIIPNSFPTWNVNQALTIFRPSEALTSEWLYYFLCGGYSVKSVINETRGSAGQVNISLSQCRAFKLPLPPLAEQKRIVAKLDALNAKSARARTELARIETLVSRYKQAVLSKAFSGELALRQGGKAEIQFTPKHSAQIDGRTPDLPALPATWSWVALSSVAEVSGGLTKNSKRDSLPLQVPYLRVANVYANELRLDDVSVIGCTENEVTRTTLTAGDLLLVEGNGSLDQIGRVAIWGGELEQCVHQNHLIKVRPRGGLDSKFALYWLLSPLGRRAIEAVAASSSGLHTLSLSKVGGLPLPLCNLEEQHEIVRRIESAFAKIDRLAKEAKRALELVGKLDEAILAKAFRGELVPQDENDEPAEHLLARIRAERAAAPKGKRGRKVAGQ